MNGTLLQKPSARRVIGMVVGIVIIGLGIALFKQSHLGNDSISALNMRLAELFGISLGVQNIAANLLMFAIEIWVGRQYIGLGTFVNGICIGFIVTAFYDPIAAFFGPAASLPEQLLWVAAAVIVTALGASLYQTADLGIAPYDALALELRDHTPVPYFGCRVFTDAVCALACWMLGGLVGLGTLICAFCLGPVIQFFNGHFSEKCCGISRGKPEHRICTVTGMRCRRPCGSAGRRRRRTLPRGNSEWRKWNITQIFRKTITSTPKLHGINCGWQARGGRMFTFTRPRAMARRSCSTAICGGAGISGSAARA